MKEYYIKLNQRPTGLRVTEVRKGQQARTNSGQHGRQFTTPEAQRLKALNDRIKILEMELQKAREESFRVGYEEGQKSVLSEAQKRVDTMKIEMQSMELKYLEAIEKVEGPLLALSKKMASMVLGMDLNLTENADQVLFERLRKMMYEVIDQNKVIIQVNPEQLADINPDQLAQELNLPPKMQLSFLGKDTLKKGEAVLETEDFHVDGTFAGQVEQLYESVKQDKK